MIRTNRQFSILCGAFVAAGTFTAVAAKFDITVPDPYTGSGDKYFGGNPGDSVSAPSGYREDNEVENNAIANQSWDLEGFVVNTPASGPSTLAIVAGFDMKSGNASNASGGNEFEMGDIFVRLNSPVNHLNTGANFNTGYDFVIHFTESARDTSAAGNSADWIPPVSYSVYSAGQVTSLASTVSESGGSGALHAGLKWYASTTTGNAIYNGNANYTDNQTAAQLSGAGYSGYGDGVSGDGANHDILSDIALSWLAPYVNSTTTSIEFYTTMQCGNDVLTGRARPGQNITVPDGGSTVLLMGAGLTGLGLIRRRLF